MNMILKSIVALLFTLSLGASAHAAGLKGELKTEEVKKFNETLKSFGIDGVKLNGLDLLVEMRPELKSSFVELTRQMAEKPQFFKSNKDAVTRLVTSINASTGMAAEVLSKMNDGQGGVKVPETVPAARASIVKQKASDILKACEALPGSLATVALGKNGDIARLQKVADVLAKVTRKNIITESTEVDVIAGKLTGTEAAPKTVDDIKILVEKALNEGRTDGKKFTLEDLIKACLEAMRKA